MCSEKLLDSNKSRFLFLNHRLPPIARKSVRLISPHVPQQCVVSFLTLTPPNSEHTVHLQHSVTGREVARALRPNVNPTAASSPLCVISMNNFSCHYSLSYYLFLFFLTICLATAAPSIYCLTAFFSFLLTSCNWKSSETHRPQSLHLGDLPTYAVMMFFFTAEEFCFYNPGGDSTTNQAVMSV